MAAAIGPVLQGAGMGLGVVSDVQQADIEAKSLQSEARSVEEQAAFDERQSRRQSRLLQGHANAQAAASGIDISSGSPLLLELDRAKQSEIEALSIRRAGKMGADARRYGARLARRSIPYTVAAAGTKAGGSLLSGFMGGGSAGGGTAGATPDLSSLFKRA